MDSREERGRREAGAVWGLWRGSVGRLNSDSFGFWCLGLIFCAVIEVVRIVYRRNICSYTHCRYERLVRAEPLVHLLQLHSLAL